MILYECHSFAHETGVGGEICCDSSAERRGKLRGKKLSRRRCDQFTKFGLHPIHKYQSRITIDPSPN